MPPQSDKPLFPNLARDRLPHHVAVIMDGNGRWAKQRGLPRIEGHAKGIDAVRELVRACRRLGIGCLTLYAFSMENWNRPDAEIKALFELLRHFLRKELPDLEKNGIQLRVLGRWDRLPEEVRDDLNMAMRRTESGREMVLNVALSYSGRDELVRAVQGLAIELTAGKLTPEDIEEKTISDHLDTAGLPDPDLLIRTSGEMRVSNYLLWQIAYAEIYVTDALWPDFDLDEFERALQDYAGRERRFGQTSEQLTGNLTPGQKGNKRG